MSLYQCEECGCCENTALGWYWMNEHTDPKYNKRKLCSACGPTSYSDGKPTERFGKWHEQFERTFYPVGTMETDENGNLKEKDEVKAKRS